MYERPQRGTSPDRLGPDQVANPSVAEAINPPSDRGIRRNPPKRPESGERSEPVCRASPEGEREAGGSVQGATAGSAENGHAKARERSEPERGCGVEAVAVWCVQYPAYYATFAENWRFPLAINGGVLG
jgi:hypothetical protein